jgi:hypothetical protein
MAMRILGFGLCVLTSFLGCIVAQAQDIGWQEAVARLAGERTKAETCGRLLKQYGDKAAVSQGELTYAEAKGDIDAVIAGLIVALAKADPPDSLPDLEARLQQGVKGREAVCAQAEPLVPKTSGQKDVIADLVSGALEPLIGAVKELWIHYSEKAGEQDLLIRTTIQTQLEATKWPAFAEIPSSN